MTAPRVHPWDRLQRLAGRALSALPPAVQIALSGGRPVRAGDETLDPQVQLIRAIRRLRHRWGLCEPSIPEGRARYRRETTGFAGPRTPVRAVRDLVIDGGLAARHYAAGPGAPVTVYLHGGGFVMGDLDTHDEPCRLLCAHGGTHVLAVAYRLAPEHPFPVALEDAATALAWARGHAAALGADPRRVAMGGDSAGANLAAVVALGSPATPPAALLLLYPPTDGVTPRPSWELFDREFFLDRADRRAFDQAYGAPADDWRVSPLRSAGLGALPPTLVATAGLDILRDEGEAFAEAARAAGSQVRLMRVHGHCHGFIHMTGVSPSARDAVIRVARAWRELLETLEGA